MKDYKKILEGIVNIINTTEKSDIGFANICSYIGENCPELKESEDERIKRRIIQALHGDVLDMEETTKAIAWLEKQGEQEHVIAPKFDIGDIIKNKITNEVFTITDRCISLEYYHDINHLHEVKFSEQDNWELVKQKPADKVEPKFKIEEGKWYVCIRDLLDNYANKAFRKGDIYLSTQNGSLIPSNSNVLFKVACPDTYFRDWTIQDAKKGDVLIDKSYVGETPFIFKEVKPTNIKTDLINPLAVLGYCGIGGAGFTKGSGWGDTANCTYYPATKEQRALLFQKMKEAGYEWNAEKKELTKIENEIEIPFGAKDSELQEVTYFIPEGFHAEIEDDKVVIKKGENPAEWSEEDEMIALSIEQVMNCASLLNIVPEKIDKIRTWLKSLNSRNTWRPSDEQMYNLSEAAHYNCAFFDMEILRGLYDDLKKLREE